MFKLIYHKYQLANSSLLPDVQSVLDVGCRDAILKQHLRAGIRYAGLDLMPGPCVDHVCNVEHGLPFGPGEFDAVIALDLLEHTNDIWFVFDELLRVARKQAVVLLPNAYHWSFRLRFAAGKEMGKYVLPPEPILDRHRWLLSYPSIRRFCTERAQRAGWRATEHILFGSRRTALVDWALAPVAKNMAAWAVLYVLEKEQLTETSSTSGRSQPT